MTKFVAKFSALKQSQVSVYQRVRVIRKNARNSAIIERAQGLISDDPEQSLRKLASIVGVGKPMRRIVEEDLRYKSYTIKIRYRYSLLKQTELFATIYCSLKNKALGRIRFFSDEKIFTVDIKINRRNDRWLAYRMSLLLSEWNFRPMNTRCCVQWGWCHTTKFL